MKFKIILNLLFLNCIFTILSEENFTYLTYDLSGGRFGDDLVSYCHAKWLSFKYDIPLLYKPFKYSDELILSNEETKLDYGKLNNYQTIYIDGEKNIISKNINDKNKLYILGYFPEAKIELTWLNSWKILHDYLSIDWDNKNFKNILQTMIKPKNSISIFYPPKNIFSVAIHIRTGGNFDPESYKYTYTLKMPPYSYYVEQIKKIKNIMGDKKIYFHIFTDDNNPQKIVDFLKKEIIDLKNIELGFREFENNWDKNVLEDFFSILNFDCLIMTQSNFSIIASKLKEYQITIMPISSKFENNAITIDKVEIVIKN